MNGYLPCIKGNRHREGIRHLIPGYLKVYPKTKGGAPPRQCLYQERTPRRKGMKRKEEETATKAASGFIGESATFLPPS
jgi:hypothetical protein